MRALPTTVAALVLLASVAALAPAATADAAPEECYGVTVASKDTGVCIVHDCLSSPSGSGIVVVVNGRRGECIGL